MSDSTAHASEVLGLSDVISVVRDRWVAFVVALLVVLVASIGLWLLRPTTFEATASVSVAPLSADHSGQVPSDGLVNTGSEKQAATSIPVLKRAAGPDGDVTALQSAVSVEVPVESLVLLITAEAPTSTSAAERANAVAEAYLGERQRASLEDTSAVIKVLDKATTMRERQLKELAAKRDTAARERAERLSLELGELSKQREALSLVPLVPGRIISPAQVPDTSASFGPAIYLAGGLGLGMIIGLLVALARHKSDRLVRTSDRLQNAAHPELVLTPENAEEAVATVALHLSIPQARHQVATTFGILDLTEGEFAHDVAEALGREDRPVAVHGFGDLGLDEAMPLFSSAVADDIRPTVLDLGTGSAGSRAVLLASRCDVVVVLANPKSNIRAVRTFATSLAAAGSHVQIAVMTQRTTQHYATKTRVPSESSAQ